MQGKREVCYRRSNAMPALWERIGRDAIHHASPIHLSDEEVSRIRASAANGIAALELMERIPCNWCSATPSCRSWMVTNWPTYSPAFSRYPADVRQRLRRQAGPGRVQFRILSHPAIAFFPILASGRNGLKMRRVSVANQDTLFFANRLNLHSP